MTLKSRRDGRQASADQPLTDLARQVADTGERLSRLYGSIEAGTIDGADPALKDRVAALKSARDSAMGALDYAKRSSALPIEIDPVAIDRFARLMREQLITGDVAGRKTYLSAVVDVIVVSDNTIRIVGSNENIRAALGPNGQPTPPVRKSVQEWCARRDSNSCPWIRSQAFDRSAKSLSKQRYAVGVERTANRYKCTLRQEQALTQAAAGIPRGLETCSPRSVPVASTSASDTS
ncbi:MAG: hypothetical protein JWP84_1586 [Tardiphaga sp.]|nr:hypothetical protein [Tardiphaga sp.]